MLVAISGLSGPQDLPIYSALTAGFANTVPVPEGFACPEHPPSFVPAPLLPDLCRVAPLDPNTAMVVATSIDSVEHLDRIVAWEGAHVVFLEEPIVQTLRRIHSQANDGSEFVDFFWSTGLGSSWRFAAQKATSEVAHERVYRISTTNPSAEDLEFLRNLGFAGDLVINPEPVTTPPPDIEAQLEQVVAWTTSQVHEMPRLNSRTLASDLVVARDQRHASTTERPPKLSIVTPVFNDVAHIAETIESVLSQRYPNVEYVVMDGGSTDGTADVIARYADDLSDWVSAPDEGHADAVNKGFERTDGEVMAWLNSGDIYYPGAFETVAQILDNHHEINWLQGLPNFVDENGATVFVNRRHGVWNQHDYLLTEHTVQHVQQEATFWRRSLWETAGGRLDTAISLANDCELWQRFFRYSALQNIECLLGGFRMHEGQRSVAQKDTYQREAATILQRERDRLGISRADAQRLRDESAVLPPITFDLELGRFGRRFDPDFRAREPWEQFRRVNKNHAQAQRKLTELQTKLDRLTNGEGPSDGG